MGRSKGSTDPPFQMLCSRHGQSVKLQGHCRCESLLCFLFFSFLFSLSSFYVFVTHTHPLFAPYHNKSKQSIKVTDFALVAVSLAITSHVAFTLSSILSTCKVEGSPSLDGAGNRMLYQGFRWHVLANAHEDILQASLLQERHLLECVAELGDPQLPVYCI